MFTIGDFARHGRMSLRMLRHYDATGLLRPARVDLGSGYRFYEAGQLRGMLRLRQAGLQSQIAADTSRLARVEARLQIIEMEGAMPADDIQVKPIPAVRVAELTAIAASLEPTAITPVIQPLYRELGERLGRAGLAPVLWKLVG